ncbi:UNVERIFIED_ORG: hypothetical protein FNL38_102527 [Nocardia globerula]|uniref:Uncharacterized protein n=1 Tax=Nocardia globerula TaxID=1818 RepID=A0A652YTJ3_NOCGL
MSHPAFDEIINSSRWDAKSSRKIRPKLVSALPYGGP